MKTYRTSSSKQTKEIGAQVARAILASAAKSKTISRGAKVLALYGDLGAGKTTFTQGFIKALGARGRVTSPTFVLMKRFFLAGATAAKEAGFENSYHIDAYRFNSPQESDALGLKELFRDPKAIIVVEWPERLEGILPRRRMNLRFSHGNGEQERVIIAP